MRAGYFPLAVAGPLISHLKPLPHTRSKAGVYCLWLLFICFLAWGITMTAVYATRGIVCETATTCTALGLPAWMCDATGTIYGSACASSADCAHADTCCLNTTGTSVSACSSHEYLTCLKNSTASTHGVCQAIVGSNDIARLGIDSHVSLPSSCRPVDGSTTGTCHSTSICTFGGFGSAGNINCSKCSSYPNLGFACWQGWCICAI